MKKIIITYIACLFALLTSAQEDSKTIIPSINGPAGNYLYIVSLDDINEGRFLPTDKFVIKRIEKQTADQATKASDAKKIGECKSITKYSELKDYFSEEDLTELKEQYGNINNAELLTKFTDYGSLDSIAFIYGFVETRQALGHIFLDKKVKDGHHYIYEITKVSAQGEESPWGYSYTKGGMGNYSLPYLKPSWVDAGGKDSLVKLKWVLPLSQEKFSAIPLGNEVAESRISEVLHSSTRRSV